MKAKEFIYPHMAQQSASNFSMSRDATLHQACNCMGPQNGEPECPCRMKRIAHEQAAEQAKFAAKDQRIRELEAALELAESLLRKATKYTNARDMKVAEAVKHAATMLIHANPLNYKAAIYSMNLADIVREVK